MKKKLLSVFCLTFLFALVSCDIADINLSADNSKRQGEFYRTAKAWQEVNFLEHAQPLVFGVSSGNNSGVGANSVIIGGNPSAFSPRASDGVPNPGDVPSDSIEIRSELGAGKVAGSEEGMVYFYKEVSINKNFKMQADFKVISFLPLGGTAPNGQEAWGIMARDFVPQYAGRTMDDIKNNPSIQMSLSNQANQYFAGNRGGDSNMIMVGGVKRAIRAYWRRGVAYNGISELSSGQQLGNGNPITTDIMEHANTNFYFWPREWGNYSDIGDADYQERPDFPRYYNKNDPDRNVTYRLTLEKNNNGFFWTIEHPDEGLYPESHIMAGIPRKGRVRDRTVADRYNANIKFDPNAWDPRPIIDPIDSGSIPPYEDILKSVNKENYYVGFFAARDGVVWVNNIRYWEADIDDCDPQTPVVPSQINAEFEVLTPEIYTGINYLHVKTNVPGHIIAFQDKQRIPNSVIQNNWVRGDTGSAVAHNMFIIPIKEPKNGDNTFTLSFYPNSNLPPEISKATYEGVVLASTASINRTFVITKKLYHGGTGDIYVSNDGTPRNSGTRSSPLDLQTAIIHVQPGQDIVMLNGVYMLKDGIVIPRYNNGRFGAYKTLRAEDRNKVALDWSWKKDPANNRPPYEPMKSRAFFLQGNYWKLEGFHVRNAPDDVKGMEIGGSNNIMSWLTIYSNGESGFQIAGGSSEPTSYWPSNNLVQYCESFNNRDPANTNADGFTAKLTVGKDNRYYRCISHSNVDDGWDFFAKRETGPIGVVTIEECVAYGAGVLSVKQPDGTYQWQYFGSTAGLAVRSGFKMGGEGISVKHIAIESVAFGNDGHAFTSNSNPSIIVRNSTAIDMSGSALGRIYIYANSGTVIDGYQQNSIATSPGSSDVNLTGGSIISMYNTILFPVSDPQINERSLDGFDGYQGRFIKRRDDGRPDLGNVYRPGTPGQGAWAFYN